MMTCKRGSVMLQPMQAQDTDHQSTTQAVLNVQVDALWFARGPAGSLLS